MLRLSPMVRYDLGKMSKEKQLRFHQIYSQKKRSVFLAYICLAFFPGTHYAFLGNWPLQFLFWITLGGGLIWWLFDLYRLKELVNKTNISFQKKIVLEINSVNVFHKEHSRFVSTRLSIRVA